MNKHPDRVNPVLLLGDPGLRVVCDPVTDFDDPGFIQQGERLISALEQFRAAHGFGRAIAASQIGITRRIIAMNLGDGPFLVVNPETTWQSEERFTLWDDCMSFPSLMVRVSRAKSLSLSWQDNQGQLQTWNRVDAAMSELIQHEVDHLNGILSVDHALDRESMIMREVYEANRGYYNRQVDYAIVPTTRENG